MNHVRIAGIGNSLAGDDAIGLRAVDTMREMMRTGDWQDVELLAAGTPGPELFDGLDQHDLLILIDACRSGAVAGMVLRLTPGEISSAGLRHASTHGFTLADWIELVQVTGETVPEIILFGVEIAQCGMGEPMSAAVTDALPELLRQVQDCMYLHAGVTHARATHA